MNIAQKYVEGLKKAYYDNRAEKQWVDFERIVHGASKDNMEKLRMLYPDIPDSLIQLLDIVDGTYWREYDGKKITLYFLGSDLEEYPYYLLSVEQMLKKDFDWLNDYIDRKFEGCVEVDERIIDHAENMCWLHFSDCMNNGGSSQLFIDFFPSSKGTKGQIIRYLHDPDEIEVIADSFDEYLQMLMDDGYDFITEDILED
jgi:hypothetical protein